MPNILIATPAYGETFYTPYVQSMFRLHRALDKKNVDLRFASISYADIAESRNFLLTHWFDKTDASHILFVDADMGFAPELVLRMLGLKKPVTGVIYPRREIDLGRLAEGARRGDAPERAKARAHHFIMRPLAGKAPRRQSGFMEVAGCGTGILLIERACVTRLLEKLPDLSDTAAKHNSPLARDLDRLIRAFDPILVNGARLSEDLSFCHRWHELCGGEIWADIEAEVTHIGLHRFGAKFADAMRPRVAIDGQPGSGKAQIGTSVRVAEGGKEPKVVRGKLQLPSKAERDKAKSVKH